VVAVGAVLVGLTDSGTPYRGRGRSMLVAAGAVACSTFVGVVIGAHHVVAVIVLALWSFADGMCIVGGAAAYLLVLMAPLAMVAAASGPADAVRCVGQGASRLRRRPRADRAGAHRLAAASRSAGAIRGRPRIPILAEWVGSEIDDRVPVFSALQQARAVLGDAPQALSRLVDIADLTFIDLIAICTTAWWCWSPRSPGSPSFGPLPIGCSTPRWRNPDARRLPAVADLRTWGGRRHRRRGDRRGPPVQGCGARGAGRLDRPGLIRRTRDDSPVTRCNAEAALQRSRLEPSRAPRGLDPAIADQVLAAAVPNPSCKRRTSALTQIRPALRARSESDPWIGVSERVLTRVQDSDPPPGSEPAAPSGEWTRHCLARSDDEG
jgi:hypothetical protein